MPFILKSSARFERDFTKLDSETQRRIDEFVIELRERPYLGKPTHGELRGKFSLRIGNYRVIYTLNEKEKSVTLIAVGHRRAIYG